MPTENRRVAAYLPRVIDERLETFKTDRGLKGDSPALIAILEEYFGVSREVVHSGSSLLDVESLKHDLLSELKSELSALRSEIKNELLSELKSELPKVDVPEVDQQSSSEGEPPDESLNRATDSDEDEPLGNLDSKPLDGSVTWSGVELSRRLNRGAPQISAIKDNEKLAEWSQKKDPDGIAWMRVGRGQYVPITDDHQGF